MAAISQDQEAAQWLDRPVWSTLTTRHRRFAQICGTARRLMPEIGPFAATERDDARSLDALAHLVTVSGHGATLLQAGEIAPPRSLVSCDSAMGVQMLARTKVPRPRQEGIARLGSADISEMLVLTELTEPGPFALNTHLMGRYWGLRIEGALVAMAGERMKQPGFTEVSAVCVQPDHRRKGYGALLTATVAADIQSRGETAYLHALAENAGAIRLYETLGFRVRCPVHVARLAAPAACSRSNPADAGSVPRTQTEVSNTSPLLPRTMP